MSNSCLREGRKAACVCVVFFFFIVFCHWGYGRKGRDEGEREDGRDGVFNLLSTGEQREEAEEEV